MGLSFKAACMVVLSSVFSSQALAVNHYDVKACMPIEIDNYEDAITRRVSGIYQNPFVKNDCFALSFSARDIAFAPSLLLTKQRDILTAFELFKMKTGMDVVQVIDPTTESVYKFFKFDVNGVHFRSYKRIFAFFETLNEVYDDYMFYHEIFHLIPIEGETDAERFKYEVFADVAASITLIYQYEMDSEKATALVEQIRTIRLKSLHRIHGDSSYAKGYDILLQHIERNGVGYFDGSTFNSAYKQALELIHL
jgi:hypothetical protein